jgi:hypothetical protein
MIEASDGSDSRRFGPAGLTEDEWEHFQERAGIHEFCGGDAENVVYAGDYIRLIKDKQQAILADREVAEVCR